MILPFSTQLNGKPTYFVERIHKCFSLREVYMIAGLDPSIHYPSDYNFIAKDKKPAKLHTIREDKNDRWKVGTNIDFFINCRQKNMFRFAPVLPVVSIQKIEIIWTGSATLTPVIHIYIDDECYVTNYNIGYNTSLQRQERMEILSQNDGFDTVEKFLAYFNSDFKGKLIHWTNKKY